MSDNEQSEVTTTGIVRKRNGNGYVIHPDRHDTGGFDRRIGWSFIIAAILTFGISLPSYGFRGMFPLLFLCIIGMMYVQRGRRKRRRVGGFRRKRRTREQDNNGENTLLDSDPIWRYRHYWALLGFGSVVATVVAGDGPLGELVPVVTLVAIVVLATLGWIRKKGTS